MSDRKHTCHCLEANDGWCPKHGRITREPDELLHDARMMEAEMKEQTGHTHCPRCNTWVEDMNAHRCGMTDQELEEIEGRLERYQGSPPPTCGDDGFAVVSEAVNEFFDCADVDIATLLAEVRRLRGALRETQRQTVEAIDAMHRGKPTVAGGRMVAVNTTCDKALNPEGWNDAKRS